MEALRTMLRRECAAAWRHRWIALAFAWLFCLIGWFGVSMIPDQYEASARLHVDADAVLTPLLRGIAIDATPTGQLEVLQRTLLSRPNLEKLISKTDLELNVTGPADLEYLVVKLGQEIKVQPQSRDLFTITYRNPTPRLAYDVVQTLVTTFVESTSGSNRSDMENARQFLQTQIDNYERELRAAEKKRAEFKAKYVDLLPSDSTGQTRLEAQEAALGKLHGELQDAVATRELLTKQLAQTPPLVVTEADQGGGGGGSSACIVEEEQKLQDLLVRMTDKAPEVIAQRKIVAARRAAGCGSAGANRTAARSRSEPNRIYEQLRVRQLENDSLIASLTRQLDDSQKERDRLEEIARGAPGLLAQYSNINRDYDVIRKNYDELLSRRESMRIGAAAETGADKVKLEIIDPPKLPQIPAAPKRWLLMIGVLGAALAGGVAVSVLLVQFDTAFHSIDDLRGLGLPVVGGISMREAAMSMKRRIFSVATFTTALLLLCAICGGLVYHLLRTPGAA